jgi:hypothetical protein
MNAHDFIKSLLDALGVAHQEIAARDASILELEVSNHELEQDRAALERELVTRAPMPYVEPDPGPIEGPEEIDEEGEDDGRPFIESHPGFAPPAPPPDSVRCPSHTWLPVPQETRSASRVQCALVNKHPGAHASDAGSAPALLWPDLAEQEDQRCSADSEVGNRCERIAGHEGSHWAGAFFIATCRDEVDRSNEGRAPLSCEHVYGHKGPHQQRIFRDDDLARAPGLYTWTRPDAGLADRAFTPGPVLTFTPAKGTEPAEKPPADEKGGAYGA